MQRARAGGMWACWRSSERRWVWWCLRIWALKMVFLVWREEEGNIWYLYIFYGKVNVVIG